MNEHGKGKRLFVDLYGTLTMFHDEVSCIEQIYERGFVAGLQPYHKMVEGVRNFMHLHPDVEVFTLSSVSMLRTDESEWLDKYLPEIDSEHRLYPNADEDKISLVPNGVSNNDFLLDDYNRWLLEFEAAGGNPIKCHNDINQRGPGVYDGNFSQLWVGPTLHTDDHPEMISAELAQHMDFPITNLDRIVEAYGVALLLDNGQKIVPKQDNGDIPLVWLVYDSSTGRYKTPNGSFDYRNILNAIRAEWRYGSRDYCEFSVAGTVRATRGELSCINTNVDLEEGYSRQNASSRTTWPETVLRMLTNHVPFTQDEEDDLTAAAREMVVQTKCAALNHYMEI